MPPDRSRNVEVFGRPPKQSEQHARQEHFCGGETRNVRRRGEESNDVELKKRRKLDAVKLSRETDEPETAKSSPLPAGHGTISSISSDELVFYPAYCHSVSPTWFTWVKLTALDIHQTLQIRDGYQHTLQIGYRPERNASVVLFYLNHPIQFVQVVGIVVNLESYFERFWLFTIDDSSGATIDVICSKPIAKVEGVNTVLPPSVAKSNANDDSGNNNGEEILAELNKQVAKDVSIGTVVQIKGTVTLFRRHKGAAVLDGVDRPAWPPSGSTDRPQQPIDIDRPIRQINLSRLRVVPSTSAEISLIDARAKFHASVLSKPWILSLGRVQKLRHKALGEVERVRKRSERQTKKIVHIAAEEVRDADTIQREYEHEDELRLREAELAKNAGERLARQKEKQIQNTPSEPYHNSGHLDEKAVLLRAAFG